jgi:hypothetical protein
MWGLCFVVALHKYILSYPLQMINLIWQEFNNNLKLSLMELNLTMGLFCYFWDKVGLKAMVLEQSDKLLIEGVSITLWNNTMHIFDLFDIGNQFKNMYINMPRYVLVSHI